MPPPSPPPVDDGPTRWTVGCHLGIEVERDATLVLHVAPARAAGVEVDDALDVSLDGRALRCHRIEGHHGDVIHVVRSAPGSLTVDVRATAVARPTSIAVPDDLSEARSELDLDQLTYLRQSRYCPSDELGGLVAYELGHLEPGPELLAEVTAWVASRLTYELGCSGPLDTAIDSLLRGRGVCRDFAHVAITALRALDVPARMVAAYAPGLSPMDFHAVVEAHVGGAWWVLDPTRLAPRPTLLRIATGRDAADTAFLTVIGGEATLHATEVFASTDVDLPDDDHASVVRLPAVP